MTLEPTDTTSARRINAKQAFPFCEHRNKNLESPIGGLRPPFPPENICSGFFQRRVMKAFVAIKFKQKWMMPCMFSESFSIRLMFDTNQINL